MTVFKNTFVIPAIAFAVGVLLNMGFATSGAMAQADGADVRAVRVGLSSATKTRIVFDLAHAPQFMLSAGGSGAGVLTVALVDLDDLADGALPRRGVGHVARVGVTASSSRGLVFSVPLAKSAKVSDAFVIEPSTAKPYHRLVIDLVSADPGALAKSVDRWATAKVSGASPGATKPQTIADVIEAAIEPQSGIAPILAKAERKVIVIDPGHGGSDPGATGADGTFEKTVTLAAAKALEKALEPYGRYDVVLTRARDIRFALPERQKFARRADADLFISLHADALGNKSVSGASVYTLSEEGTARSAAQALAEGDYVVADTNIGEEDPDVGGILIDLAQRRTGNQSDRLAQLLISKLGGVAPLLNNTHRKGNLNVLLAPDVPAVLLELGFMSNRKDNANLTSAAWRRKTMDAVARAIDAYFRDEEAGARHAKNTAAAQN